MATRHIFFSFLRTAAPAITLGPSLQFKSATLTLILPHSSRIRSSIIITRYSAIQPPPSLPLSRQHLIPLSSCSVVLTAPLPLCATPRLHRLHQINKVKATACALITRAIVWRNTERSSHLSSIVSLSCAARNAPSRMRTGTTMRKANTPVYAVGPNCSGIHSCCGHAHIHL